MRSQGEPITAEAISIPFCTIPIAGLVDVSEQYCLSMNASLVDFDDNTPREIGSVVRVNGQAFLIVAVQHRNDETFVNLAPWWPVSDVTTTDLRRENVREGDIYEFPRERVTLLHQNGIRDMFYYNGVAFQIHAVFPETIQARVATLEQERQWLGSREDISADALSVNNPSPEFFDISRIHTPADRAAFQEGQADRIRGVRANQVMIDDVQEIDPAVLSRVRGEFARAGTDVRFEDMEITDVREFVGDDGIHRTSVAMRATNPVPGEPFTLAFNLQPTPGEPNRNGDIFEAGAYEMQSTEFDAQTTQVDESDQHPDNH